MSREKHAKLVALLIWVVAIVLAPARAGWGEETVAKGDPILADLKVEGKAEWRHEWNPESSGKSPPSLQIEVRLRGTAVAKASASGKLRLDSLVDETGKSYRWACESYPRMDGPTFAIFGRDIDSGKDGLSLDFKLRNRPSIKSIRELRGSLVVMTGGESQEITIKDAFKRLEDRSEEENLDPDGWSRPLEDKTLKELGLKVTVSRGPLDRRYIPAEVKDSVGVSIESSSCAIVGWDVVDAQGKGLKIRGSSWGGMAPKWSFEFQTTALVPRDGAIRLKIHKNDRKVVVPFVLKDIGVPEVPKSLDIAASADDAYVAAEKLPAEDPVMAGLKLSAKARWQKWRDNKQPPELTLSIELAGETESRISAYGEFDFESASDESGHRIGFSGMQREMIAHFREQHRYGPKHLALGAMADAGHEIKKIRELRGSMSIQIGDKPEVVTIKDFLRGMKLNKPLADPRLNSLGIVATVERRESSHEDHGGEEMSIALSWKKNALVLCRVCDGEGKPLAETSDSLSYMSTRRVTFWGSFQREVPEDAQLQLSVQKNVRKIRVPFSFKEIEVPENSGANKETRRDSDPSAG